MIFRRFITFFHVWTRFFFLWIGQITGLRRLYHWMFFRHIRYEKMTMPKIMRRVFEELGPTYIKLGQMVASSPGLFPIRYAEEFKKCLDRVPSFPTDLAYRIIEEGLGKPVGEIFASIDEVPIAAASIAQVHGAVLKSGEDVVIKIQRPRIRERVLADMRIMGFWAKVIERTVPRVELANPVGIIEDFRATLLEEIDFRKEAANMDEFNRFFHEVGETHLAAPKVYWELTSERVLTMERFYGFKADDIEQVKRLGLDSERYLRIGVRGWLMTLLLDGFFHGDIHAGNLMYLPDRDQLGFIDFGIIGRFTQKQRLQVLRYILSFTARDFRSLADLMVEMGAAPPDVDRDSFARDMDAAFAPLLEKNIAEIRYEEVLPSVLRGATKYRVRLPREFILILKQLLYFDRYSKLTAPNLNVFSDLYLVDFLFNPMAARYGINMNELAGFFMAIQQRIAEQQARKNSAQLG
jgi:predicted unusual protein kinase regulating ubiquinone biosynthesis (AarF/ABC1/UbiB family)